MSSPSLGLAWRVGFFTQNFALCEYPKKKIPFISHLLRIGEAKRPISRIRPINLLQGCSNDYVPAAGGFFSRSSNDFISFTFRLLWWRFSVSLCGRWRGCTGSSRRRMFKLRSNLLATDLRSTNLHSADLLSTELLAGLLATCLFSTCILTTCLHRRQRIVRRQWHLVQPISCWSEFWRRNFVSSFQRWIGQPIVAA